MKLTCIIIDSDEDIVHEIKSFLKKKSDIVLLATFTTSISAIDFISKKQEIDIVFLDIDMPEITGIELASLFKKRFNKLVFTSGSTKNVSEGYRICDAMMFKPIGLSKFNIILNKLINELQNSLPAIQNQDFIFIKTNESAQRIIKIEFDSIVMIESLPNYVRIYTIGGELISHIALKNVQQVLSHRKEFIQVHRGFLISKNHILTVDGNSLIMSNQKTVKIGDNYKDEIQSFISNNLLKLSAKK